MAFEYRKGALCAEQVPLEEIARRFGTPCYVYSRAAIERHYGEFARALAGQSALIAYSVKANSNLAVLALLAKLGAGFDMGQAKHRLSAIESQLDAAIAKQEKLF